MTPGTVTGGYTATEEMCARLGLELVGMGIRYPRRTLRPDVPALALLADVVADPASRELFAARVQHGGQRLGGDAEGRAAQRRPRG